MLYWNQASGTNIHVSGEDLSGKPKSPGYNEKCGFKPGELAEEKVGTTLMNCLGAQNDIFAAAAGRSRRFAKDVW